MKEGRRDTKGEHHYTGEQGTEATEPRQRTFRAYPNPQGRCGQEREIVAGTVWPLLTCPETSTASRKFPRSLGTSGRPFIGPMKGTVGRAIVVGNEGQDVSA